MLLHRLLFQYPALQQASKPRSRLPIPQWSIPLLAETSIGSSVGQIWAFERVPDETNPYGTRWRPKLD